MLSFLPERVDEVVDDATWDAGEAWLRSCFPGALEVRCERADGLQFVAAGSNFESVSCPRCGADLMEIWGDAMENAWNGSAFERIAWSTPCCRAEVSLHDLDYSWVQGFARTWLSVHEPGSDWDPDALRAGAESALGVPVRLVIAHL